jgi:hypothetical protein
MSGAAGRCKGAARGGGAMKGVSSVSTSLKRTLFSYPLGRWVNKV